LSGIRDYSPTAASNLSVGGISIAEGMARASVNNAQRAVLADTADLLLDLGGGTVTSGSANAYLLALDSTPSAYADNLFFLATANHTNTGAATLNLNGLGLKDIEKMVDGVAVPLTGGELRAGQITMFTYSSANNSFILLSGGSGGVGGSTQTFETLAAASTAYLGDNDGILTTGFTTAGDGGEGVYKVQTATPVAPEIGFPAIGGRWIVLAGDRINLKAMGASLLAADDQTDYLQDAVNALKPIFIPGGTVTISQSILYDTYLNIEGAGGNNATGANPSIILGNLATPLIHRSALLIVDDYPNPPIYSGDSSAGTGSRLALRHLTLRNSSTAHGASCVQVYNSACPVPIEHVYFESGWRGAEMIQPFGATLVDCRFNSTYSTTHNVLDPAVDYRDSVGLILFQGRAFNCEIVGFGTAARLWGSASIYGGRFEVNGLGIGIGERAISYAANNGNVPLSASVVEGITLEANHIGIEVTSMNDSRVANISNYSSTNGPARTYRGAPYEGYGDIGLIVLNGNQGSIIEAISMNGSYMKYTHDIRPTFEGQLRGIYGVNAVVPTTSVTRPVGIRKTNMMNRDSTATKGRRGIFEIDTYDKAAALSDDGARYVSHMGNLRIPALVAPDNTKAPVYGRNLAGTLPVVSGATSATYTFQAGAGEGTAQFNGAITAVALPGSSLTAGTYYYATTLVGPRGETGVTGPLSAVPAVGANYKSVAIAADQKARMALFAADSPLNRLRRRIYRGTTLGAQFDGFWEMAGTVTTFDDDGTQAFDGYSYPPPAGTGYVVPSHVEPDASYYIQVQPTWATSWYVSAKSTTAFTVTFGTAAPSDQTVGWLMYRP